MSEKDATESKDAEAPEVEDLPPPSDAELEAQEQAMKSLLARVKPKEGEEPKPDAPIVPAVQRKIRARSKGKFYSDGWSVEAGRINYVLIAGVMLVVLAIAYFALGPVGVSK